MLAFCAVYSVLLLVVTGLLLSFYVAVFQLLAAIFCSATECYLVGDSKRLLIVLGTRVEVSGCGTTYKTLTGFIYSEEGSI